MTTTPPRWNLSNIYTSVEDPRLQSDMQWCQTQTSLLEARFETELQSLTRESALPETLTPLLNQLVDDLNALILKTATIDAYLYGLITTNSFDKQAEQTLSRFEIARVPFQNLLVRLRAWFGRLGKALPEALTTPGSAHLWQRKCMKAIELKRHAQEIEAEIQHLIDQDPDLRNLATLLISIPELARSWPRICYRFLKSAPEPYNPKSLAAFIGICPGNQAVEPQLRTPHLTALWSSGIAQVTQHLAAMFIATHQQQFRLYYLWCMPRKEKPKQLVINNLANKLIKIMVAVART